MAVYQTPCGEHGYTTRWEWSRFILEYDSIIRSLSDDSYALSRSSAPLGTWVRQYIHHSTQTRQTYIKAEALLDQHIRWFTESPGRWVEPVARPLLDQLFRSATHLEDPEVLCTVIRSLEDYFTPSGDEIALMKCWTVQAVCNLLLDPMHTGDVTWVYCQKARAVYERCFESLDQEERSMGLTIYDVALDLLQAGLAMHRQPVRPLVDLFLNLYRSAAWAETQVLDADLNFEFNRTLPPFDRYLAFAALTLSPGECSREQAELMRQSADRLPATIEIRGDTYRYIGAELAQRMSRRLLGECSDGALTQFLTDALAELARREAIFYDLQDLTIPDTVRAVYQAAETVLGGLGRPPEAYYGALELFLNYFSRLPFSPYLNFVSSSYIYCYILRSLARLDHRQDLLSALLRLAVFRQPQTAVHSLMVGRLTEAIAANVIDRAPALFVGQLGAASPGAVQARREEFLDFLYTGALLHDLGKLLCPNVVNTQYRQITRPGYDVVQYHARTGGELLASLPRFAIYADIALGHHKSWDGRYGYPDSFDNTASPIKIFIDLITISDTLDAATDHLGRSYTVAKTFDQVLAELAEGAGSRYSPALVAHIQGDAVLQDRLRHLLDQGRAETYHQVHQVIRDRAVISGRRPAAAAL